MQTRITKLYTCPDCETATDGKSCRCGWRKPKRKILRSTDYVPLPEFTEEDRKKSIEAMNYQFKKLLREKPEALGNTALARRLHAEIREETKQEETDGEM